MRRRHRPVKWLWDGRVALGTLALVGGREGIGKSILAYTLAADITRGRLPGAFFFGTPKAVIVAATEDSWAHTIVPRLIAADADLTLVYRVDIQSADGIIDTAVSLPRDLSVFRGTAPNRTRAVRVALPCCFLGWTRHSTRIKTPRCEWRSSLSFDSQRRRARR